ncbi:hypothetical protein [Helicobacter cappadocius]|uniref:Periplasmic protein n=1 Tax=Helicobacter cappadocius TaxID=3063998 RepID=A0AA90T9I2_9HELI|nr:MULTISPECIES: hypothetical protein [unclassified Helicobacter]MDO7252839.1 hypothetical protein [Helicobacter sp. faydin-H75]MDP2538882.1 hypothetical protein [Helicobacter sp. faydin-H76]
MKKWTALCMFLVLGSCSIFAKSYIISPLPLPKQEVVDITIDKCNEKCLEKLYSEGKIFSFVAKFKNDTHNIQLRANLAVALSEIDSFMQSSMYQDIKNSQIKIALLIPKKIVGRYSVASIDTILAYLMTRGGDFNFKVFDSGGESPSDLSEAYSRIEQEKYEFVIALLTQAGVENFIESTYVSIPTYIPTINKNQLINPSRLPSKLYFGGIDYKAQMQTIVTLAGSNPIVEYDDDSPVGLSLSETLDEMDSNIAYKSTISSQEAATFAKNLSFQEDFLQDSVIVLNTPVVKSGLMLSQLGFSKKKPLKILSTQINYNPSLLMLVLPKDRQNLYIINAIGNTNQKLIEYGSLLSSDLRYDWVNYSTAIGVEMFFNLKDPKINKFFSELINDNQVQYNNTIYRTRGSIFEPIE